MNDRKPSTKELISRLKIRIAAIAMLCFSVVLIPAASIYQLSIIPLTFALKSFIRSFLYQYKEGKKVTSRFYEIILFCCRTGKKH